MKNLFIAIAAALVSLSANAYTIDPAASKIEWKGTKKIGSAHHGGIAVKEGKIETNAKGEITGGTIVIDMKTISNEDLKDSPDYQKKLVGHLSSNDFFDVEKYPTSTFKITKVTKKSATEVVLTGDLTMIGKTNPVEVPAKIKMDKTTATGEATLKIDRTKWGLKYGSGNFFKELAADKIINDEFELKINLSAKK